MLNIKKLVEKLERVIADDNQVMMGMPQMPSEPAMPGVEMSSPAMPSSVDEETGDMQSSIPSSVDQEATEMFTGDIKAMIVNAGDVLSHIEQGHEIEPWMQGKITLASDYVSAVRDYLIGNKE